MKGVREEADRMGSESCGEKVWPNWEIRKTCPAPGGRQLKEQSPTVRQSWASSLLSLCKLSLLIQQVFAEHLPCGTHTPS